MATSTNKDSTERQGLPGLFRSNIGSILIMMVEVEVNIYLFNMRRSPRS
jgi:hypothetical protein